MDSKPIWQSKTFWVNGLTLAAAVLTALSGQSQHIPADWLPYIASGIAAVNIALRFLTDKPVALFKE